MSTNLGIGVPVPRLLPVTGTWTLPFAAYVIYLSNRMFFLRIKTKKYLGESLPADADNPSVPNALQIENRCHANFVENVPIAFIVAAAAELNGANRKVLNYAFTALFVLRILHVELGLKGKDTIGFGRPIGFFGTHGIIAGLAGYTAWLVKGYWGY